MNSSLQAWNQEQAEESNQCCTSEQNTSNARKSVGIVPFYSIIFLFDPLKQVYRYISPYLFCIFFHTFNYFVAIVFLELLIHFELFQFFEKISKCTSNISYFIPFNLQTTKCLRVDKQYDRTKCSKIFALNPEFDGNQIFLNIERHSWNFRDLHWRSAHIQSSNM